MGPWLPPPLVGAKSAGQRLQTGTKGRKFWGTLAQKLAQPSFAPAKKPPPPGGLLAGPGAGTGAGAGIGAGAG